MDNDTDQPETLGDECFDEDCSRMHYDKDDRFFHERSFGTVMAQGVSPTLAEPAPLRVFVVEGEGLSTQYDVYDEWVVLAYNLTQAKNFVRQCDTYTPAAEPLTVKEGTTPKTVEHGVVYSSFHPG